MVMAVEAVGDVKPGPLFPINLLPRYTRRKFTETQYG